MTDPRFTDPRFSDQRNDPHYIPPAPLRDESTGGVWGWVAGIAVVALIAFVIAAGWNSATKDTMATAPATSPAPITTGSGAPVRNVTPPSTTGSGATSPLTNPAPTPAAPAANSNSQQ